jgi:NADH-quinone oxidoreductase subunit C
VETLEQIKSRIEAAVSGARLEIIPNDSPSGQRSLLVDREHAYAVAQFLRDDSQFRLDYVSNVTGIDWLDAELTEKIKVKKVIDGVEKEVEEVKKTARPGYLTVL